MASACHQQETGASLLQGKSHAVTLVHRKQEVVDDQAIFANWPEAFDADMRKACRSVCLSLDNCSAHQSDEIALTNVHFCVFPPNCTSCAAVLDEGVIRSVKCA